MEEVEEGHPSSTPLPPPLPRNVSKLGKLYYHRQFLTLQSDDQNFAVEEFWIFWLVRKINEWQTRLCQDLHENCNKKVLVGILRPLICTFKSWSQTNDTSEKYLNVIGTQGLWDLNIPISPLPHKVSIIFEPWPQHWYLVAQAKAQFQGCFLRKFSAWYCECDGWVKIKADYFSLLR